MDRLLVMAVEDDQEGVAVFEVDDNIASDLELASGDGTTARARMSLEQALSQVRPALAKVTELVRHVSPSEAEIGFGLKIGGESGVIIAKGTTEVNFTIRLLWKRAEPDAVNAA
ncbi:CU044_2847 family protein [Virgisporangium aurantiacum]|uniref:Trypsin-co-occurring domain-containing protein n=1 Tax=Virgisporangium aurantiacum TaxID=175570 RepID=A0A8J3ZFD4_9ACTN|nr:CU044_2847 family protein [Virgisporangium aurantiacum]GIJ63092.1 hypothetical protein Vau01_106080 [Virgisporangium aurantiacum]